MLDKNLVPNLVAAALLLVGLALDGTAAALLTSTGLFALSGALTNWLAVHMLFERVPGLRGSGVIVVHFEEIKAGILRMVREQLLDPERVAALFARQRAGGDGDGQGTSAANAIDLAPLLESIDLDAAFDQLVATILDSSFGSMLQMLGGESALAPLREPFRRRMERLLADAARSPRLKALVAEQLGGAAASERFAARLETLLRARLDELTPEAVRDLMQSMIRHHLGWLVVWGGVFGGLIGFVAALVGLY